MQEHLSTLIELPIPFSTCQLSYLRTPTSLPFPVTGLCYLLSLPKTRIKNTQEIAMLLYNQAVRVF